MVQLALYQPDIPQNVGAAIRLCACLGIPLHIIEPCGFPWDEKKIRTSAMDYFDLLTLEKHESWESFYHHAQGRIILLTTKTDLSFKEFHFEHNDILLMGRESAGAPEEVHKTVDARVTIPMAGGARSFNVINAAALVLGHAL